MYIDKKSFINYLIYEDFNEIGYQVYDPNDKNILNKDEVSITMNHFNNLTKDFIKAIREVDGDNARTLIVDTIFADVSTTNFWLKYNTDFLNYINEDGNCMLAYHFYYPNSYTIVNADESAIIRTGTMESFKESILKVLKQMEDTKVQNGLDYCITEFGCNRQNKDEKYVYEWYKTIYDFCKEHKVGLVMWNDGKESKEVINRVEAKENIPGLIDIIHDYNLSV